jgi:hypothetical protein
VSKGGGVGGLVRGDMHSFPVMQGRQVEHRAGGYNGPRGACVDVCQGGVVMVGGMLHYQGVSAVLSGCTARVVLFVLHRLLGLAGRGVLVGLKRECGSGGGGASGSSG